MFRYFQPRVYLVAAAILFAATVAAGASAVQWAYGIERKIGRASCRERV